MSDESPNPPSFESIEPTEDEFYHGVSNGEVGDVTESFRNIEFPSAIAIGSTNTYLKELKDSRDLYLRIPQKIIQFYKKWDILGLLYLFLPPARFECMRIWTNDVMTSKGYELSESMLRRDLQISALVGKPFSPRELIKLIQALVGVESAVA